jgi:hypothetical protein
VGKAKEMRLRRDQKVFARVLSTLWLGFALAHSLPCSAQDRDAARTAGIVVVDGVKYPRTDAGITAAIASLNGPGEVKLSAGVYQLSKAIEITSPGIHVVGVGYGSRLTAVNPTANLFHISAPLFVLADVEISTTVAHTAGSVIDIDSDQGEVRHVRLAGNFYGGFTLASQRAGLWNFDDVRVVGGSTWSYLFILRSPANTVASTKVFHLSISNAVHWKTASIVLDTGVDTFICSDSELGPVLVQNSLHGQAPRWIRFSNAFIEAGYAGKVSGTGLQIDAARDLRYQGYIATSQYGVTIGPEARGVAIANTELVNIGRSAATIDSAARDISITQDTFENTGVEGNGAFDTVSIAPNAVDFNVSYNMFKSSSPNRPRYNLVVPPKCATCVYDGNRYGGFQAAAVSTSK